MFILVIFNKTFLCEKFFFRKLKKIRSHYLKLFRLFDKEFNEAYFYRLSDVFIASSDLFIHTNSLKKTEKRIE